MRIKRIGKTNFYRTPYGIGYKVSSQKLAYKLNVALVCIVSLIVLAMILWILN